MQQAATDAVLTQSLKAWNRRRLEARRIERSARRYLEAARAFDDRHPNLPFWPQSAKAMSFSHTGHVGDVLYALPAARVLAADRPFSLFLKPGTPAGSGASHPVGTVRLTDDMIERLLPLLRAQPFMSLAARHVNEPIDIELDVFRDAPVNTERGNIARWYCAVFAVSLDLSRPWLHAERMAGVDDMVIVARSSRYRNPALDYAFLRTLPRVGFVGIESEYEQMHAVLPRLEFIRTDDFLQLARVIRGCRLFIGNQSSPFAIAEALKVTRILEVCPRLPNVIPEGVGGYEAWLQPQFEFLVKHCLSAGPKNPAPD